MNYLNIYNSLIQKGQRENLDCRSIYERHHITPRCMGGSDDDSNIVNLTPEQHYTAHLLLAKIYDIPELWFAVNMMAGNGQSPSNKKTPNRCNNKSYGFVRRRLSSLLPDTMRNSYAKKAGFVDYMDQCEKVWKAFIFERKSSTEISLEFNIAKANVERSLKYYAMALNLDDVLSEVRKENRCRISKEVRNSFTPEQEERRILAIKSLDTSSRDAKMSDDRKGSGNPMYGKRFKQNVIKCPHCQMIGGASSMKRWHFDNCKEKYEN